MGSKKVSFFEKNAEEARIHAELETVRRRGLEAEDQLGIKLIELYTQQDAELWRLQKQAVAAAVVAAAEGFGAERCQQEKPASATSSPSK